MGSGEASETDGSGTVASLWAPRRLFYDGASLYIATYSKLRKADLATSAVTSMGTTFSPNWLGNGGALITNGTSLIVVSSDMACVMKFE